MANIYLSTSNTAVAASSNLSVNSMVISVVFLSVVLLIGALNIIKDIAIWKEAQKCKSEEKCMFLKAQTHKQRCDLESRKEWFKQNKNKCQNCSSKTINSLNGEVEIRAGCNSPYVGILIKFANIGLKVLPYLSFVYTLAMALNVNVH